MQRILSALLISIALLLTSACFGGADEDNPDDIGDYQAPNGFQTDADGDVSADVTAESLAWREELLASPLIAEVEHLGVRYEVHMYDSVKYMYNTETGELVSGQTPGDVRGVVLRDWVVPHGSTDLDPEDALFQSVWDNSGSRLRELIGYCDKNYTLVTRARTSDYVEYVYKDEGKTDSTSSGSLSSGEPKKAGIHYRIAATDDFILYSPLDFKYVFDVDSY